MHRIDTPGHDEGLFRNGNPQVGQQGTIMDADWANDVQENICSVIEAAGEDLEKGDFDQLKLAIQSMIDSALLSTLPPLASVLLVDGSPAQPPAGYIRFDTEYLRADYPLLVAHYTAEARLIAGSTGAHFRTPDYDGRFIRLTSSDNAVDPDGPRAAGSLQDDQLGSHTHSVSPPSADSEGGAGRTVTGATGTGESLTSYNTASAGGAETRPKNVAMTPFLAAR